MFTIRFPTEIYRPDLAVTLRNNVDGWTDDIPGEYASDEWRFLLDEDRYPAGLVFKFVLEHTYWMIGPNLFLQPVAGGDYQFTENLVRFPRITELVVENGYVQTLFLSRTWMRLTFTMSLSSALALAVVCLPTSFPI